jgi:tetratricopeptide (TPR) repeat protein
LNEIDEAISHLCQLTNTEKLINQDIEIYLLKARLYYIQGKPFLAAADLKIASQINPKHPALYSLTFKILEIANDIKNKASTEIIRNDLKAAISYLSQAIELDSEDYKILMLRGIVYGRLEKNQEGLDDLLEVYTWPNRNGDQEKELSIEIAKLHEKIAVFLFESQAKYEMALERFQLSFNFNPNNPKTFKSRADCYLKMGNRQDDAIRDLMAVYHFDPKKSTLNSTIEFKSLLSDVKEKLCSIYTKRAKTQIDKAMSLPLSSDTARHKDYSAAVSNLTTAMKYQADSSPSSLLLFERARCFFYMQNLESMKQDIEECLALHPNHALSLALLSLYDMMPYPSLPFPKREIPAINAISQITREKQQDLILSNDKEQSGKQVEKDGLMVKGKLEALKKGLLPEINIEKMDELFKKVGLV